MGKLREKYNFDLNKYYIQMNLYPNSLCLNKKMYLLYNYWNKGKKFFWLKSDHKENRYAYNYIGFISLNSNILLQYIKFDYFNKWSSSLTQYDGANMKNSFYLNTEKKFIDCSKSLDYSISDDIFLGYIISEKKNALYFNKNEFILNFLFKLSKKNEILRIKECIDINLLDEIFFFNENYNDKLYIYHWKKKFIKNFIYKNIWIYIRYFLLKNLIKNINLYFSYKKNINLYFLKKKSIYIFFKNTFLNKNIINVDKYFKNKNMKKKNFILFRKFFQHLYFIKRINRRMFGYKMRLKYSRGLFFLKKRFMPTMRHSIYKNFKKKNFYSFLNKYNNKNFYSRKFLGVQNLIYNQSFKKKYICKKKKRRKNFLKGHRFYKKLNTFYYIPDTGRTREQVYKRFKKSVVKKFKKKKFRKSFRHVTGLRFNLSLYNARHRYRNRLKAKALQKKSTPLFHFFKGKINNYQKSKKLNIDKKYYELPFFVLKKHRFNVEKKKKLYLKRENWILFKVFRRIRNKSYKKNKKIWFHLFKKRSFMFRRFKFLEYVKFLRTKWRSKCLKHKKKNLKNLKLYNEKLNKYGSKSKKAFWFFQKILLYWKNIVKFKKENNNLPNILYIIKNSSYFFNLINKTLLLINFKFIKLFKLNKSIKLRKKKKKIYVISFF